MIITEFYVHVTSQQISNFMFEINVFKIFENTVLPTKLLKIIIVSNPAGRVLRNYLVS